MLHMAAQTGTTDIVATPHANDRYVYNLDAVQRKVAELRGICKDGIQIHHGCDFHLSFQNIQDALKNPAKYTINGQNYLLVEFSDMAIPPNATGIFEDMLSAGMTPIITHPERNPIIRSHPELLNEWVGRDCLVQVTADSLLGRFGKSALKAAAGWIENDLVHVVASDAHNTQSRTPALEKAFAHIANRYSGELAEALFNSNPRAIITGQAVDATYLKTLRQRPKGWRFRPW